MEKKPIFDPWELDRKKIYDIGGTLYRFSRQDPTARLDHPQWIFDPLPGQRKKTTLKVNKVKMYSGFVEELVDTTQPKKLTMVSENSIQLSIL